ncbi:MAG: hypothetical protein MSC30_17340 [Gaiellaceae bacterium MAG52_C11]|nr:hypothetical protein [Candidatus Gaiellasilicea maunaloa]
MTTEQKDILSRVQGLGEEALHKLAEVPGGARLVEMANQSRTRVDEMQKRLRGLDVLERRVDELEQRLAKLETATTTKKAAAVAKKPAVPQKPPA